MKLRNFVAGLNILLPYYDDPDDEHARFMRCYRTEYEWMELSKTDKPISKEHVQKMYDNKWVQRHGDGSAYYVYDHNDGWHFDV